MRQYNDEVIVLRGQLLGEADRILTLFGRETGRIRAVAKGVRRTSSKFGARLEPGNIVDAQLYSRGRGLETITQAVTVHAYAARLADDYTVYAAAGAILEAADRLLPAEPAPLQWALLAGALRDLAGRGHPAELILDGYLLRALSLAGWKPTFTDCARCGAAGPHQVISLTVGGVVCEEHRRDAGALLHVDVPTLRLLWALLVGNWRVAEASEDASRAAARKIVAAYAHYHLEHGLRALSLLSEPDII